VSTSAAPRLAVQLYAVRDELQRDLDGTLGRLRAIGFEGVETAVYDPAADLVALAGRLAAHDLEVVGVHAMLPTNDEHQEFARRQADAFGTTRVIFPGMREEPRVATVAGFADVVDELRVAAEFLEGHGLCLGVHHHWWELRRLPDGRVGLLAIAEALGEPTFFELDGYWDALAGVDVEPIAQALAGRTPLAHIKDGPADDPSAPMTALGHGAVDLDRQLRAARGAEWWIAELSHCATDMLTALAMCHDYLARRR
jgi:sugar phosphate isomerase/epimerase